MKLHLIYLLCLFISCVFGALHPNWRLTWSDEFDTLDTSKWNIRNIPGNYGNGEKQWYHPSQVSVSNGNLVITAKRQAFGGMDYLSGRMDTQDKAFFTYGRFEVRAKMVGGKGMWPAMWLLSQDKCWASGAEIDLAEFRGSYPKNIGTYYHYASKCCKSFSNCISSKGSEHATGIDLTKDFHVYAVEWWPNNMTWFFDGQIIESYRTSSLSVPQDLSPHFWVINSAVGGGYPGYPDQTTVFPNYHQVDYVRNYVWRPSCSGVTCSNHGCCKASTSLCVCDAGWAGANCEYNVGSASNTFDDVTSLDNIPNGWGNAYTLYLTKNSVISSGALRLTLTNEGCPSNCGNVPYSSGGWEGIRRYSYGTFTFRARPSRIPGTGFSLTAAGESTALEQIAFSFLGGNSTFVQLWTWTNNWAYNHVNIRLGFDASSQYHDYKFTWSASKITWYVDNVQVHESSVVMPNATRLSPGAYYTAQPEWYGAFSYSYPSYAYITNFAWQITPATASCN